MAKAQLSIMESKSWSFTYPPVGVATGRNHNDLIFEKGKLLRIIRPAVHQGLYTFLMRPDSRNLQETCGLFSVVYRKMYMTEISQRVKYRMSNSAF